MRFLNDFVERQTQHMLDFIARISVSLTSLLTPAIPLPSLQRVACVCRVPIRTSQACQNSVSRLPPPRTA